MKNMKCLNVKWQVAARLAVSSIVLVGLLTACDGSPLGSASVAPNSNFVLLDASVMNTSDFKGKVTLVNFWATSCTTCIAEMPKMVSTYNQYRPKGFELVAVAMAYDPPSYVVNYAQTRQLPFKVALDNTGKIAKDWGDVRLTPTTYLLDKQGLIVKRYVGEPDFTELHRLIERLLAA